MWPPIFPVPPMPLADARGVLDLFLQLPPAHPILVNLTAGLIPAAVGFDLVGRLAKRESMASAGFWMMMLAAVVTPLTALSGWLWMDDMGSAGDAITFHKWLGTVLAAVVVALAAWRWAVRRRHVGTELTLTPHDTFRRSPRGPTGPGPAYLSVAVLFVLALIAQGHLGGMLSFGGEGHDENHESPMSTQAQAAAPSAPPPATPADDGWKASIHVGPEPSPATEPAR